MLLVSVLDKYFLLLSDSFITVRSDNMFKARSTLCSPGRFSFPLFCLNYQNSYLGFDYWYCLLFVISNLTPCLFNPLYHFYLVFINYEVPVYLYTPSYSTDEYTSNIRWSGRKVSTDWVEKMEKNALFDMINVANDVKCMQMRTLCTDHTA